VSLSSLSVQGLHMSFAFNRLPQLPTIVGNDGTIVVALLSFCMLSSLQVDSGHRADLHPVTPLLVAPKPRCYLLFCQFRRMFCHVLCAGHEPGPFHESTTRTCHFDALVHVSIGVIGGVSLFIVDSEGGFSWIAIVVVVIGLVLNHPVIEIFGAGGVALFPLILVCCWTTKSCSWFSSCTLLSEHRNTVMRGRSPQTIGSRKKNEQESTVESMTQRHKKP
jgi:hypothetical protein